MGWKHTSKDGGGGGQGVGQRVGQGVGQWAAAGVAQWVGLSIRKYDKRRHSL